MVRSVSFRIEKETPGSLARAGVLTTPHGDIQTPAFIAVATKATIKGISPDRFEALGVQSVIANAYHLYLSGLPAVEKVGGVGRFMGFAGPTMTDSGGFQVFSLGAGFDKKVSKIISPQESSSQKVLGSASPEPDRFVQEIPAPAVWDEDLATSHGKLAIIDEEGVSFTSHLDGSLHRFTPERSVEIQHQLGADYRRGVR